MSPLKITLTGLKSAGKQSILRCLQEQFYYIFSPIMPQQKNPLIEFIDGKISIIYPNKSNREPCGGNFSDIDKKTLFKTNYLIFIIDIQNEENYEKNIEYFRKILTNINTKLNHTQIMIFFHKMDYEMDKAKYKVPMHTLLKQMLNELRKYPIPIFNHITSIYHPFTIFSAFSRPIIQNHGIFSPINYILANFAQNHHLQHISLLTESLVTLGEYSEENQEEKSLKSSICKYLRQSRELFQVQPEIQIQINQHIYHFQKFYLKNGLHESAIFLIWNLDREIERQIIDEVYNLRENIKYFLSEVPVSFLA